MSNISRSPLAMTETVREEAAQAVLCWLATIDMNGRPNVTPKEIWTPYNESMLVVADIASTNSVRNMRSNPEVCLSFIDIFRQKGYKFKGIGEIFAEGSNQFEIYGRKLKEIAGTKFHIRNVMLITVTKVERIWAPSYNLSPKTTEEDLMRDAFRTYGVAPAKPDF